MIPIGIMQGRLSPPVRSLQAFPWLTWEREFTNAQALGLDCIEWLFAAEDYERNPLWTEAGIRRIRHLMGVHGIKIPSVCATYFMEHPFFRVSAEEQAANEVILKRLIEQAARIGARVILVPVLEVSEIRTDAEADRLDSALRTCLSVAHAFGIRLALETELPADRYVGLIARFGDPCVGAYYDIGNATAKGIDPAHDIRVLGNAICGVHVKDRKRDGPNVLLGQGDADFTTSFVALQDVAYEGPLILETAFGVDFMADAAAHRLFVQDHWQAAPSRLPDAKGITRAIT